MTLYFYSVYVLVNKIQIIIRSRIYYMAVPDFIDLHYKDFHWFTFNVADICITFGIILYLIFDMFRFKNAVNE